MLRAFEGLHVVDLSDRLSGAFAARLFGDYGADVILAEPPGGHPLRREPPFLGDEPGLERSVLHAYANWNKRSLVVDEVLREEAGITDSEYDELVAAGVTGALDDTA